MTTFYRERHSTGNIHPSDIWRHVTELLVTGVAKLMTRTCVTTMLPQRSGTNHPVTLRHISERRG